MSRGPDCPPVILGSRPGAAASPPRAVTHLTRVGCLSDAYSQAGRAVVPKAQASILAYSGAQGREGAWEPPPVLLPLQEVLRGVHPPPTVASFHPTLAKQGSSSSAMNPRST